MKTKYALVLSGGGFKGAFQIGALNYLAKNWKGIAPESDGVMKFDLIAGISVGSLNGVFLAMNKLQELNDFWKIVETKGMETFITSDFIDTTSNSEKVKIQFKPKQIKERFLKGFNPDFSLFDIIFKKKREKKFEELFEKALETCGKNFADFKGIAENKGLRDVLVQHLDAALIKDTKYMCGFVSLDDGAYCCIDHTNFKTNGDFVNGVIASTVMPLVWAPIPEIQLKHRTIKNAVDGGIRNVSPLGDVIEEIRKDTDVAKYKIIIINCNTGKVNPDDYSNKNALQILFRSLGEIALAEIFNNDIAQFVQINDLVDQAKPNQLMHYDSETGRRTQKVLKHFDSIIIQPDNGELGDPLVTSAELCKRRLEFGWQKAAEAIGGPSII